MGIFRPARILYSEFPKTQRHISSVLRQKGNVKTDVIRKQSTSSFPETVEIVIEVSRSIIMRPRSLITY